MMDSEEFVNYANERMRILPVVHGEDIVTHMMDMYRIRDYMNAAIEKYSVIEQLPDGSFYERVFACKETKRDGFVWQEIMAISEKYGKIGRNIFWCDCIYCPGMHVYGFNKEDYVSHYYGESFEYCQKMDYLNDYLASKRVYRECFTSIDDVIQIDQSLKYCAYNDSSSIDMIDYISLYRKFPVTEMLMKCEIYGMFNEKALKEITENKHFRSWLFKNRNSLYKLSFRSAYNSYKKNPDRDPWNYQEEINAKIMYSKETKFRDEELGKKIRKNNSAEHIYTYLRTNHIDIFSYEDYIRACDWLELDFADTKIVYPKQFWKMHEDYTKQYAEYHERMERKQHRKEKMNIAIQMLATAKSCSFLSYSDKKYKVIVAKSKKELIHEGAVLKHCVGRMDYDKKQAEGKSVICFIRRYGNLDKPYVTVEIDFNKNIKVLQCYGKKDRTVPELDDFIKKWIAAAKKKRTEILLKKCA